MKRRNAGRFLIKLSAESFAGRIELHYLREFNLVETIELKNPASLQNDLCLFDIACHQQDVTKLKHYIDDLEKDIRALITISDLNMYQKLLDIIAEQTGSVRQDKTICDALSCSRDTLKKYRGYLLATLVYREVYPFIGHSLKRLVKSPKGYLLNNGLISYLTGIDDLTILQKTGLIGHRFENWFLKELSVWLDSSVKRSEIYYWRTTGGIEVDFVVEKKPDICPFEIAYSIQKNNKKIKNLRAFLQAEPKAKMGFYIYSGDFEYDANAKICFIPTWALG